MARDYITRYTKTLCDPEDTSHNANALNKIHTLTDLGCFLKFGGRMPKSKVTIIYNLLLKCKNSDEMNTLTHDLIMGKETADQLIRRKAKEIDEIIKEGVIELP